jgi:hypothetical protein
MNHPLLRVEGWRGISHSFALVNQRQLLAWMARGGVRLQHHDLPFYAASWNPLQHNAGLTPQDRERLEVLDARNTERPDAIYRIAFPAAVSDARDERTPQFTFMVCEYGLPVSYLAPGLSAPADLLRDGDRVVTPSTWARDQLLRFGMPEEQVSVIPHGVCRETFRPCDPDEREALRRTLGFTADHFVFCNVGIPSWNKGLDRLLIAFARVHARHPNARLVLKNHRALYGLAADEIFRSVAHAHPGLLSEAVMRAIFLIENNLDQSDLQAVYACADCYVSPYRAEGFNLPVLEALACGTPVVVTAGGPTDDFCPDGLATRIPSRLRATEPERFVGGLWLDIDIDALLTAMADAVSQGPRRLAGPVWARHLARMDWSRPSEELLALMFPAFRPVATPRSRPALETDRTAEAAAV